MTYQEFLAKLRETPREWAVREDGRLRNSGLKCPIEAVAGTRPHAVALALEELGEPCDGWNPVISAADGSVNWPQVRADLLSACGLATPETE